MSGDRTARMSLDDGFRGSIPIGVATAGVLVLSIVLRVAGREDAGELLVVVACAAYSAAFLVYLAWTHLVFTRAPAAVVTRAARSQRIRVRSAWARAFSFGTSEGPAITASLIAFIGSLAVSVYGISGGVIAVTVAALLMAATAWATVAYTYALAYMRLHYAGQEFTFPFGEHPVFTDFLGLGLMISSAGSYAPASPTTREGVRALRSHTVIAFVFNALVIAMTVSLITNIVTSYTPA